jgi:programmed cell death protein 4
MKIAIDQLVLEYLVSGDVDEACRCIVELKAPLFFHEIVKRCIVHSLDVSPEQRPKMSELLAYLVERDQLTTQQAVKGFNRLFLLQKDLELDSPSAGAIIAEFTERAKADAVLPPDYKPPEEAPATV